LGHSGEQRGDGERNDDVVGELLGDDFEKGLDNGVHDALAVARAVAVAIV
jgi:hypothetical protein